MAEHVAQLCRDHAIHIYARQSYGGWASKKRRAICVKPVKTQRTYIVALHEIGHILGAGRSGTRLEQEAAAWAFVCDASVVPLSPATYGRMLQYLQSYLVRASRRKRMIVPPAAHWFWDVYRHILTCSGAE